jgi:hypothetical protein
VPAILGDLSAGDGPPRRLGGPAARASARSTTRGRRHLGPNHGGGANAAAASSSSNSTSTVHKPVELAAVAIDLGDAAVDRHPVADLLQSAGPAVCGHSDSASSRRRQLDLDARHAARRP